MTPHINLRYAPENTTIIVLTHKRTSHLLKVLDNLAAATDTDKCTLVFSCDRPSKEVLSIANGFIHPKKKVIVHEDLPLSSAHAINRSLYRAMLEAFKSRDCSLVVVLEDDILVSRDFLAFTLTVFENHEFRDSFRGLNLFSRMVSNLSLSNSYVIGNYGLGWGWAINARIFRKFQEFWYGNEDNHWDFIVEPYCRTGYVVNSFFSRVETIGMDMTATHTSDHQSKLLANEMSLSYKCLTSSRGIPKLTQETFFWNKDYYQRRKSNFFFWLITVVIARIIFLFFRNGTGTNRITIYIYSHFKKMYRFCGAITQKK
jgi:hypothetical protein